MYYYRFCIVRKTKKNRSNRRALGSFDIFLWEFLF